MVALSWIEMKILLMSKASILNKEDEETGKVSYR
jgi:hypothetical protein